MGERLSVSRLFSVVCVSRLFHIECTCVRVYVCGFSVSIRENQPITAAQCYPDRTTNNDIPKPSGTVKYIVKTHIAANMGSVCFSVGIVSWLMLCRYSDGDIRHVGLFYGCMDYVVWLFHRVKWIKRCPNH